VVRVVPDVPSFAVDDGFSYATPDGVSCGVGDVVRVPLGGRRVRGWVVGRGDAAGGRPLRRVIARSGDVPVFDTRLLGSLRWAAMHYVAPLAALLAKATPPNLPRVAVAESGEGEGARSGRRASTDGAGRLRVVVGPESWGAYVAGRASRSLDGGGSTMVVAATWVEATSLADHLTRDFGERVLLASSHVKPAESTAAWIEAATTPGRIVVGTREVAAWAVAGLECALVVGDGRRGLKDTATPTVHARDLLLKRSSVERFSVVVCGQVPAAESIARTMDVERIAKRSWGLVEIADRRDEPPGRSLFGAVAAAALSAAVADRRRVLLFTHRRATAYRCVRCRALRRCPSCGSGAGQGSECARCGASVGVCAECSAGRFEALGAGVARVAAEAARIVGRDLVGDAASQRRVIVGTERDLPGLSVDLTIVVDGDGPLMAPTYRAVEDGMRLMARAVGAAGTGRGRRAVIQTQQPDHPAMAALRAGDAVDLVRSDGEQRARLGFPPGGELIALEAAGLPPEWRDDPASTLGERAVVLGPATSGDRLRWLLQGRDLSSARVVLRSMVGRWREGGARVRVDADPIDL
jgi:primosomal protein N' (replication factor Y) (superfamily II helicase)